MSLDDFKARTLGKLERVECPQHRQRPQVLFHGARLSDVTISIRSCCRELSGLANLAIASPVDAREPGRLNPFGK